jgi:hypothetical protein
VLLAVASQLEIFLLQVEKGIPAASPVGWKKSSNKIKGEYDAAGL